MSVLSQKFGLLGKMLRKSPKTYHTNCIDILPNALEIAGNNYYQSWNNHVAHRVAIWDLNTEKVKQHSENADFYFNNGLTKKQFSFEAMFFHERPKMTKKISEMCQKSQKCENQ